MKVQMSLTGSYKRTEDYLKRISKVNIVSLLNKCGAEGVTALRNATPIDSGITAASWSYKVHSGKNGVTIVWSNSHIVNGVPIAIILQYGHGTGTGGYVQGQDYINPAMRPVFEEIASTLQKAVTK